MYIVLELSYITYDEYDSNVSQYVSRSYGPFNSEEEADTFKNDKKLALDYGTEYEVRKLVKP